MAYAYFSNDQYGEGRIRVSYSYTQNVSGNYTDITIDGIEFQSLKGRSGMWEAFGGFRYVEPDGTEIAGPSYFETNFYTSGTAWTNLSAYDNFRVYHDDNGTGYVDVIMTEASAGYGFDIFYVRSAQYAYECNYPDGTSIRIDFPNIDRRGPTVSLSGSVNSSGTVTLSASADVSCNSWAYCIDGSGIWYPESGTAYSKTFTIPNMTGSHSFQVRAAKASNGTIGYSSVVTTTTPTLSWNKASVSTDGTIELAVNYLPANTAVLVKYGSTQLDSYSWSYARSTTISFSSSQLKAFFTTAGVTTLQSITVTASVDGYSYTATSFTLTAGSNMAPVVGTPTVSIDQTVQPPGFPNTWIAGVSKAKIEATVASGSNSSISTVTLSYGSSSVAMTYNSTTQKYEATTPGTLTGNTVFTVTATDSRGMTGTDAYSLTGVQSYSQPTITIDEGATFRCDSEGSKQSGGLFVRVKAAVSYDTGISGNALSFLRFYVEEDGSADKTNLTNNAQSGPVPLVNPDKDDTFHIVVEAKDLIGNIVQKRMQFPGGHRDFVLANFYSSNEGRRLTALGIGMAPEISQYMSEDTIQLPVGGSVYIGGFPLQGLTHLPSDMGGAAFFMDFLRVERNMLYDFANLECGFDKPASDSMWSNVPPARSGSRWVGIRRVYWISGSCILIQILEFSPQAGTVWCNYHDGSAWSGWRYTSSST